MGKLFFRSKDMKSAAYVEEEKRGSGRNRSFTRKAGSPAITALPCGASPLASAFRSSFLYRLHYEPPKSLSVEKYSRLGEVYGEQRKYRQGRPEAKTALGRALVGLADRLSGEDVGVVSDD